MLDPTIVTRLLSRPRERGPLGALTDRERQVLALIAEGRFDQAIGDELFLSPKTVSGLLLDLLIEVDDAVLEGG